MGKDVVYVLDAQIGDVLSFRYVQPQFDAAIYLVSDCSDEVGSCFAGIDAGGTGQPEELWCAAPYTGLIYIILDTYGTDTGGAWTMDYIFTGCQGVPVVATSWGRVKSTYR